MAEISMRAAKRQDVPAIVAMLSDDFLGKGRESGADLERYYTAFDAMQDDPNNVIYVALNSDDAIVGTLQLIYMQGLSLSACKRAEIEAVRVASEARGQGIGQCMFDWAIEKARADGCGLMQLTTNKQRVDGHRFYDQIGFEQSHLGFKLKL